VKKVVILGGSGFIGFHLAEDLLAAGYAVTLFDRPNTQWKNIQHLTGKLSFVEGDVMNADDLERAIQGQDIVFHLVSTTLPQTSLQNPIYDIETNVIGTICLIEKILHHGIKKIVFISSGGTVYGIPQSVPIHETHSLNPISAYGLSKVMIEKYLYLYHHLSGLDYTVLRFANPYGEQQGVRQGQGVIRAWIEKAFCNEPVEIWGDGSVVRDYLYIKDAVKTIRLAAEQTTQDKVFNVGSGIGHSLLEIKSSIEQVTGCSLTVVYKDARLFDVPKNVLDISRIKEQLHWQPETSLFAGIKKIWDWRCQKA
jgi:UDP-glucose 4-epimerase